MENKVKYSYDEAFNASLEYFEGNDLAAKVFVDKYALRDNEDNILEKTADDMHRRIAKELARIEKNKFKDPMSEEEIFEYLQYFEKIIPQGSCMYGIGNTYSIVSLSNCFVIGKYLGDSYNGIIKTDHEIVSISKRRGGIGFDISSLRPRGMSVKNAAKTTSGAVSFMDRFSNSTREVGQNNRRGACLMTINIHHPDVEDFIDIKNNETSVTGANISVKLTDEFLQAVQNDEEYEQRWPVDDISSPIISKMVNAKKIWNKIVKSAWSMAEPGIMFWDTILKESPADCYSDFGFKTVSANPCGELILSFYDSCRLLAINLMSCINNPYTKNAEYDFEKLYKYAQISQRFMDNIIDLELESIEQIIQKIKSDPEPEEIKQYELNLWQEIYKNCNHGRRTGVGFTALGDVIAALGLNYDSDEAISVAGEIEKTIKLGVYQSSVDIAKEVGPFEIFDKELEKDNPFLLRIKDDDPKLYKDMQKYGRRNIACLTVAPTGTVSTQASFVVNNKRYFGTTSGIEPCFMMKYIRRKKMESGETDKQDFIDKVGDRWKEFSVYHSGVKAWLDVNNESDEKKSPYNNSCANNIDWIKRVELQAAIQLHNDHSISSTVNIPNDTTQEEVAKIYEAAWKYGLKGITVYRDGCRSGVLVAPKEDTQPPVERPKEVPCDVHHITVKNQQYFVLVGIVNDRPYEVFAGKNGFLTRKTKSGIIVRKKKGFYKAIFSETGDELSPITACTDEMEECITRLTSGLLRSGADMHFIVKQLERVGERQAEMNSFARSVARALKKYIPDGTSEEEKCPECQSDVVRMDGCCMCKSCGWGKCI